MKAEETDIFSDAERELLFQVDHELTHESESAYYERKKQALESGEPTWWVYSYDSDMRVYSFWLDSSELAIVAADDGVYRVYVRNPADAEAIVPSTEDSSTMLLDAPSLIAAVDAVEDHWLQ